METIIKEIGLAFLLLVVGASFGAFLVELLKMVSGGI